MAMTKQKLEFGSWEPDAAIYQGMQACEACNVLPMKRGYRPMASLAYDDFIEAAPGRVLAALSAKFVPDEVSTIIATHDGIYSLENKKWVRKYSGTAVNDNRQLCLYGSDVYCIFGRTLVRATTDASIVGNFTAVSGAPAGELLCVVQDFLVIGRTRDNEAGIHWSAIDDPTTWPAVGSDDAQFKQSDVQIFPEGGKVQAIVGGLSAGITGLVFLERGVQLMTYTGSPYIFQFSPLERSRGLLSSKSPVVAGGFCIYLSEDGWRITDGSSVKSIGDERVDRWFFSRCASDRLTDVVGVHDINNRVIWWAFASQGCADDVYDSVLIYNYAQDRWAWGKMAIEFMFSDFARGISLDDLDRYKDAQGRPNIDALPFTSLDVPSLKPGQAVLGGFTADHRLGAFQGKNLEAIVTTSEIGGDRMMVHGLRPIVDCGNAQAAPIYRSREMDLQKVGKLTKQQRDGVCYQHVSTVYLSAQVVIPAGIVWNSVVGVEALVEPEGGM